MLLRVIAGIKFVALSLYFVALCAGHASERTNRVSTVHVPGGGQAVKAQVDAKGIIHLLFDAPDGPQYARSEDAGATFSRHIAVVNAASLRPGLKFHGADLAVGKDGIVHVAMSNNAWKLKLPEEEWSLYYSRLAPGAKEFSAVRNLNRKPSEGFSLAADEKGAVTACFLSGKLFAMVSRDNGETFTTSAEIDPAWDPCNCCTTSAAYGADGNLAMLYREETNNERDMFVVIWNQSNKPSRKRISGAPWKLAGCPMTYFSINRADTGYVAAWPTKGQVYFARLAKDGTVLPPGEIKTPGTAGMRAGVLALSASDGATLVAWKNKDVLGWQIYDAKGQPQGEPSSDSSPGGGAAGVAVRDGRFLLFL